MSAHKLYVEFDVIIPSHISPEVFNSLLNNYIQLFRFTTQIHKMEIHQVDTRLVVNPIFAGRFGDGEKE